jgi:hypothetical protein
MAADPTGNSDLGAMRAELATLLDQERDISAHRARLHAQIDQFPSPLVKAEAAKLSNARRNLQLRIDQLRIELNLLTRS